MTPHQAVDKKLSQANVDPRTVEGFGDEWTRFDQHQLLSEEREELFQRYFGIFPWHALPKEPVGFDMGCGSGRWAKLVAPRVGRLYCVDASEAAIKIAKTNLREVTNCEFHVASVDWLPIEDGSMDFGYSLGVLHHVPDTEAGIQACVEKLKPGAPFLIYLYYAFDNRPRWFRVLWKTTNMFRMAVSRLPMRLRYGVCQLIAALVYLPLARLSFVLEMAGLNVGQIPLSAYRRLSFYTMRTDALDRFGTCLERRFTAYQIRTMMEQAGLRNIVFSEAVPYWCAVGYRA